MMPVGKEVAATGQAALGDPGSSRNPCRVGELEVDGLMRLLLDHAGTGKNFATACYIVHPQLHQTAAPELAVNREVEQGEFLGFPGHLKPGA